MESLTIVHATIAVGNLLLRAVGKPELPGYLDVGVDAAGRLARMLRSRTGQRKLRTAIEAELSGHELADAHDGDIEAADQAVARVLGSVAPGEALIAALHSEQDLHALVAECADREEQALLSEPARSAFRTILAASVRHAVQTALQSSDLAQLAH